MQGRALVRVRVRVLELARVQGLARVQELVRVGGRRRTAPGEPRSLTRLCRHHLGWLTSGLSQKIIHTREKSR